MVTRLPTNHASTPLLSIDTLAINPLAIRDPLWPYRTQGEAADEEMPRAFRNRRAEELVSL